MYIVRWSDHEGICQERQFTRFSDAKRDAEYLAWDYDGVEVVTPAGTRLWPLGWDEER